MQSGQIQPHRAFNTEEAPNLQPVLELPQHGDELLPLFSLEDFRVLDGLSRDFREKAYYSGPPLHFLALTILKRHSTGAGNKSTMDTSTSRLKGTHPAESFPELLRRRSPKC